MLDVVDNEEVFVVVGARRRSVIASSILSSFGVPVARPETRLSRDSSRSWKLLFIVGGGVVVFGALSLSFLWRVVM